MTEVLNAARELAPSVVAIIALAWVCTAQQKFCQKINEQHEKISEKQAGALDRLTAATEKNSDFTQLAVDLLKSHITNGKT